MLVLTSFPSCRSNQLPIVLGQDPGWHDERRRRPLPLREGGERSQEEEKNERRGFTFEINIFNEDDSLLS